MGRVQLPQAFVFDLMLGTMQKRVSLFQLSYIIGVGKPHTDVPYLNSMDFTV